LISCSEKKAEVRNEDRSGNLEIGWASADHTPYRTVLLQDQLHTMVSEGVLDSVTVTDLESEYGSGESSDKVIMIGFYLSVIDDGGRDC
jgi:hypothetical protein